MADLQPFSVLQEADKVQEIRSSMEEIQTNAKEETTEEGNDIDEEEIEEEIEVEEEEAEFQWELRAEEISLEEGAEEVMVMLDDTYEDDFEEDEDEDEQPEAEQNSSTVETRKRKFHDDSSDDEDEDYIEDEDDGEKEEAAETLPRVEDVRNFVETLVSNAVKNLEAEVFARHRKIQESGEGRGLKEGAEEGEEVQKEELDVASEDMQESSSEDESFPELSMELDGPKRDALFERGMQYQNRGRLDYALKCYLGCLKDLDETGGFSKLPQCLHQIADTFYKKEEYDKAVQFIQAEKMYYENALIDTTELQKTLNEATRLRGEGDTGPADPRVLRAMEYENLARMCVQQKKPQLALEYCGKAVKTYQAVLGEDHPATTQCLDYFTVIYAEAGRKEYSEAMGQFRTEVEQTTGSPQEQGPADGEASELRRRGPPQGSNEEEKEEDVGPVHAEQMEELEVQDLQAQTDDTTWLVLLLVFLLTLVMTLVGTYLYCRADRTSAFCTTWRSDLNYYYMSLKYKLHSYLPVGWGRD